MNIPQIKMQIQNIQMDYTIENAELSIKQEEADIQMEQPAATLEIDVVEGELHIDQSQAFSEAGLKPISQMTEEVVAKAKQTLLANISKSVQEGNQLMKGAGKGQKGQVLQQIAAQNTKMPPPQKSNVKFIPSYGAVKIDYTPSKVNIDVQVQKPIIDVTVRPVQIEATYGSVEGKMIQRPAVEIYI